MGGKGKSQAKNKAGKAFYSWTTGDEVDFVNKLGTGKWSEGSDLRHRKSWWLKQYIEVNKYQAGNPGARHIIAGLRQAQLLLDELGG